MYLRKRVIGDLYLASSLLFITLAFLYFGFTNNGLPFLIIGLALAGFGIKTKHTLIKQEKKARKKI
ncbi:MAG TPA: hypothetical protein VFF28_00540 [Candidatus Nanoarchaeia archaeon]|nr:hypothetical protein [Candidatus Nanoarchaeia archaeon]